MSASIPRFASTSQGRKVDALAYVAALREAATLPKRYQQLEYAQGSRYFYDLSRTTLDDIFQIARQFLQQEKEKIESNFFLDEPVKEPAHCHELLEKGDIADLVTIYHRIEGKSADNQRILVHANKDPLESRKEWNCFKRAMINLGNTFLLKKEKGPLFSFFDPEHIEELRSKAGDPNCYKCYKDLQMMYGYCANAFHRYLRRYAIHENRETTKIEVQQNFLNGLEEHLEKVIGLFMDFSWISPAPKGYPHENIKSLISSVRTLLSNVEKRDGIPFDFLSKEQEALLDRLLGVDIETLTHEEELFAHYSEVKVTKDTLLLVPDLDHKASTPLVYLDEEQQEKYNLLETKCQELEKRVQSAALTSSFLKISNYAFNPKDPNNLSINGNLFGSIYVCNVDSVEEVASLVPEVTYDKVLSLFKKEDTETHLHKFLADTTQLIIHPGIEPGESKVYYKALSNPEHLHACLDLINICFERKEKLFIFAPSNGADFLMAAYIYLKCRRFDISLKTVVDYCNYSKDKSKMSEHMSINVMSDQYTEFLYHELDGLARTWEEEGRYPLRKMEAVPQEEIQVPTEPQALEAAV